MNRRDFLTRATSAAIGALVLDPERLLWVPGQRTFFNISRPDTFLGYPIRFVDVEDIARIFNVPAHLLGPPIGTFVGRWEPFTTEVLVLANEARPR